MYADVDTCQCCHPAAGHQCRRRVHSRRRQQELPAAQHHRQQTAEAVLVALAMPQACVAVPQPCSQTAQSPVWLAALSRLCSLAAPPEVLRKERSSKLHPQLSMLTMMLQSSRCAAHTMCFVGELASTHLALATKWRLLALKELLPAV